MMLPHENAYDDDVHDETLPVVTIMEELYGNKNQNTKKKTKEKEKEKTKQIPKEVPQCFKIYFRF